MLGISTGLMWQGFFDSGIPLTEEEILILGVGGTLSEADITSISADNVVCRLWYDWSVSSKYLYTDTWTTTGAPDYTPILPSQHTPSDGDDIQITLNKAWVLQNYPDTALGASIGMSENDAIFKTGGDNGKSYIRLDDEYAFNVNHTLSSGTTTCDHGAGGPSAFPRSNGDNTPLSSKDIDFDNFTFFFVGEVYKNTDATVIKFQSHDDSSDYSMFRFRHKKVNPVAGRYVMDFFVDKSSARTDVTPDTTIDSGGSLATEIVLITGVGSGSGDSKLYKNGDTSDGVTDANSGGGSLKYSHDNPAAGFCLGSDFRFLTTGGASSLTETTWNWANTSSGSNDNKMYELIWYDRELTADERSAIETHLIDKYDIS